MFRKITGGIFKGAGILLLIFAAALLAYNLWDAGRADETARQTVGKLAPEIPLPEPDDSKACAAVISIDGQDYIGLLRIPRLDLELPVMAEWSYEGLKIAPGRYSGCAHTDDLILAAHNYEHHFGGLQSLKPGDAVTFTDVFGNVFSYEVSLVEILEADAVEQMTAGDWALTLFTCTPGGQKRVTVRCKRTV